MKYLRHIAIHDRDTEEAGIVVISHPRLDLRGAPLHTPGALRLWTLPACRLIFAMTLIFFLFGPSISMGSQENVESEAVEAGNDSPALRKFNRKYRLCLLQQDEENRCERAALLAQEVATQAETAQTVHRPAWLKLLQDLQVLAGNKGEALQVAESRIQLLRTAQSADQVALLLMGEANQYQSRGNALFALQLLDLALNLVEAAPVRFEAIMQKGRALEAAHIPDAAVDFYRATAEAYLDTAPELAREAHYRAAETFFRHKRIELAIEECEIIEESYAGTPEAERARHSRYSWSHFLNPDGSQTRPTPTTVKVGTQSIETAPASPGNEKAPGDD